MGNAWSSLSSSLVGLDEKKIREKKRRVVVYSHVVGFIVSQQIAFEVMA